MRTEVLQRLRGRCKDRCRKTFDFNVHAGGQSTIQRGLQRVLKRRKLRHMHAKAPHGLNRPIIAHARQSTRMCAIRPELPHLDLVLCIPAPIIADHRDEGQPFARSRFKLWQMKPGCPIAHQGDHRRRRGRERRNADL